MSESLPYMTLAPEDRSLFFEWVLALCALLLLAVLIDLVRRRLQRARNVEAEWRRAEEKARQKGVAQGDWNLLREVVARWMPRAPLAAVTERHHFDACIEAELADIEGRGDLEQYEAVGALLRRLRTRLGLDFVPYGQQIHSTRELGLRQRVWVAPVSPVPPDWFRTRVAEVTEAHFALTPWPGAEGAPPTFEPGEEVRCHMRRDDDARYAFIATLLRFEPAPPVWVFHHTAKLNRIQSREYYRAHIDQETTVAILAQHTPDVALADRTVRIRLEGRVTSLSGGGLAVVVDQSIAVETVVRVGLKLPGEKPIQVYVRVVDDEPVADGHHWIRGAFIEMTEETRDRITHYVSQRQQMLLASEMHVEEMM